MGIRVYNSLSRKKEDFEPINPPKVGMYVCGPTVYMESHIGHGVGPVIFDTIKRYLTFRGYDVTMVINVTDVDDKLIERARKLNTTVQELARQVEDDYMRNIEQLGVANVDHFPRATECIPQIVELVQVYRNHSPRILPRPGIARALHPVSTSATPPTSPSGRRRSRASPRGIPLGGRADPAGTSNAPR